MKIENAIKSQQNIFNILKSAKDNNRLSHAYLFYGPKGTGKKEMAYALACMIYNDGELDLNSSVSKTILDNNHMNVTYIGILEDKKGIVKEQVLDLQEEFSKTSLVDGVRIYIVDGIDTATQSAQNSLLKFIEDPQNQTPTIGIFIAEELSNVVSTIQSRCVLYHFDELNNQVMINILSDEGIPDLDSRLLSSLTNDSDEARIIYENDYYEKDKNLFLELIKLKKKSSGTLFYINNLDTFTDYNNLTILLKWCLLFLEDCIKASGGKDGLILIPLYDKIVEYRKRNLSSLEAKIELVLTLFDKLKYNIITKNVFFELMKEFI